MKPEIDFSLSADKKTYTFRIRDMHGSQTVTFEAHRDKDQTEIMVNTVLGILNHRLQRHYTSPPTKREEESPSPATSSTTMTSKSTTTPGFFEGLVDKVFGPAPTIKVEKPATIDIVQSELSRKRKDKEVVSDSDDEECVITQVVKRPRP